MIMNDAILGCDETETAPDTLLSVVTPSVYPGPGHQYTHNTTLSQLPLLTLVAPPHQYLLN